MKQKKLAFVFLVCLCGLSACGMPEKTETEKINIGLASYNQSDTYINELVSCFKEECNRLETNQHKISVTVQDAAGSQKIQNDQVKRLIKEGCNVLCVNLADRTNPSEIIEAAKESDIPIIFFNREPVAEDLNQWEKLYYVGAKAKQSGVMQGELAADLIWERKTVDRNKDGKIQYVVLEGEMGHQDAIVRTESAVDSLKEKGVELEKLSYEIANWNRAQAQNRMTQMINQYNNQIELVLANNDDMALGAIDAYEKLGYTETDIPAFLGIDGTDEGLEAVLEEKMAATVYNDKEVQANAMAQLARQLVTGEKMKKVEFENQRYIYLPYEKVTKDNVQDFLK